MGELRIALLGAVQVVYDGRPLRPFRTTKEQALFVFLLTETFSKAGVLHSREALIELLWSKLPVESARANLRQTLYRLRKMIPVQERRAGEGSIRLIESNRLSVWLNADYHYSLDLTAFHQQLSLNQLEQAVSLYRGDFLEKFFVPDSVEFESWAAGRRSELRRLALEALDKLVRRNMAQEGFEAAEKYARQQLAIDDLQERAHRNLMEALAWLGRRSAALKQYEICRRCLAEDLGIGPSPATENLYKQIVAGPLAAEARTSTKTMTVMPEGRLELPERERQADTTSIFVERQRELADLSAALDTARSGSGQIRFVIGGAGRGKTALVTEFARRALASDPDLLVAIGYCRDQSGYGDPYAPFREALARLTGDGESEAGGFQFSSLLRQRTAPAASWIIPLLLTHAPDLVGTLVRADDLLKRVVAFSGPDSPWIGPLRAWENTSHLENLQQDRLFAEIMILLKHTAARQPILLILEDLHLADSTSIALLFHISQEIGHCPIFLVGTYRPEEVGPAIGGDAKSPLANIAGELKRRHGSIWLDLADMTEDEGQAFVDKFLDAMPNRLAEGFRRALFAHTGGHALFTVELFRTLTERGDLIQDEDGRWQACDSIHWSTLPARVEGVIEQRLGLLDGDLQAALTIASVEGETFTAEVVASVQEQDQGRLVRRLSRVAGSQHRLVRPETLSQSPNQRISRYRFRHQLFRQYLYQSLDRAEKVYLHEEVGRALEALYGPLAEQEAARLAWHFEKAGLTEKAIVYLTQAARQAVRLGAHDQVIEHASRGIELMKGLPQSAQTAQYDLDFQIILGNAFVATKGFGSIEAGVVFERANRLCAKVGHTPQIFPVLSGLWGYYIHRAEYETALELATYALTLAQQTEDSGAILNASSLMGVTLFYLGEYASSLQHMEGVIETYDLELHGTLALLYGQDPGVCALSIAALTLLRLGYPERALAYSDRALQLARVVSYPFVLAFTLLLALWLHAARYEMRALLAIVDEQIELTSRHGFPLQLAIAQFDALWARGMLGEASDVIPQMERALADWEGTGAEVGKSVLLGGLAEVCLKAGRIAEGLNFVQAGMKHSRASGEACFTADLFRIRGELLWHQGYPKREVEADFRRAIELAYEQNARLQALRAIVNLCRLWQEQGREEEALQKLTESFDGFSEGFDEPALREARQLIQVLSAKGPIKGEGIIQKEGRASV
jgi:DNA-binding SARP family transcriptional activator